MEIYKWKEHVPHMTKVAERHLEPLFYINENNLFASSLFDLCGEVYLFFKYIRPYPNNWINFQYFFNGMSPFVQKSIFIYESGEKSKSFADPVASTFHHLYCSYRYDINILAIYVHNQLVIFFEFDRAFYHSTTLLGERNTVYSILFACCCFCSVLFCLISKYTLTSRD